METQTQGPAWNLNTEYSSTRAPELSADLRKLDSLFDAIEALNPKLESDERIGTAQQLFKLRDQAGVLLQNAATFASCLLSVNSRDAEAQALQGRLQTYQKRFGDAAEPLNQFCDLATDDDISAYLADPDVAAAGFLVNHSRKRRHELLSLKEEGLVNGLSQDGHSRLGPSVFSTLRHPEVQRADRQRRAADGHRPGSRADAAAG